MLDATRSQQSKLLDEVRGLAYAATRALTLRAPRGNTYRAPELLSSSFATSYR